MKQHIIITLILKRINDKTENILNIYINLLVAYSKCQKTHVCRNILVTLHTCKLILCTFELLIFYRIIIFALKKSTPVPGQHEPNGSQKGVAYFKVQ